MINYKPNCRSKEECRSTMDWLDMVLSSMSDGLSVFDSDYRWILMNRVDRERLRLNGFDPESLLGKTVWQIFPHLLNTEGERKMREAMEQRVSVYFEEKHFGRWLEIHLSPTDDGGVAAITRDITERKKQAENERNTERQKLDRFAELLPIGIMLISPDYRVLFENRFFRERFGDCDSKLCYELLFNRGMPCANCKGRHVLNTNIADYWECEDSKGSSYGFYGFPFIESDEWPAVLIIGIDITERKHVQQQLEKANKQLIARAEQLRALWIELSRVEDRQRRSMAQVLHDELQQFLVAIKFCAEFLASQIESQNLKLEARRILDLISQSIDVTRSLTTQLSPPVLNEAGLERGLHWLARWMQEKHGLHVEVQTPDDSLELPEDLRTMLFQIIRELLFNVVKHSGVKEANVTMSRNGSEMVHFTIEDPGKGFNVDDAAAKPSEGFGLFSIRERLSFISGKMDIASEPDRGTRVRLSIPIPQQKASGPEPASPGDPIMPAPASAAQDLIRVLVVDDHSVVRDGLVEILNKQPGMVVVGEAADGRQAIEQARNLHPTVALMDVTLPVMSGIEATRQITQEMPDVHVIGLSMHRQEDMENEMRKAGAIQYILKDSPIDRIVTSIYESAEPDAQHGDVQPIRH